MENNLLIKYFNFTNILKFEFFIVETILFEIILFNKIILTGDLLFKENRV